MNEQEAKRLCALRELVRETFAQTLMIRTDTISDTADFFDELGGDSLDSLDVAVHLEEICGQRVPEEEYALCRCVEDAALLLLRLEQGGAPEAAPEEELMEVMDFCSEVGLPVTLAEMGITDPARVMSAAEKACAPGETIHNMPGDVTPQQLFDAMLAADQMGQYYFES